MLPETLTTSLKEWAVVQRSLLEGHQIVLVRKGGLIEETGDFDLKSRSFLFFPTYAHETERHGDLQPCFGQWLDEEEARNPNLHTSPQPSPWKGEGEVLRIEAFADVTDVVRVDDRKILVNLMPQHIWSRQFIDGRYDWEPYKPVFVLVLRAYKLSEETLVPMLPSYGGCRSWIDLAEPISISNAIPAISDSTFERRRELTLELLGLPKSTL